MASRVLSRAACRSLTQTTSRMGTSSPTMSALSARGFRSSTRMMETPPGALPVKKPVGAFRGGLFGFLLGSTLAGVSVYYYVLEEYRVSNELLTEDIYSLQAAVQRIHTFVSGLEDRLDAVEKKKGANK